MTEPEKKACPTCKRNMRYYVDGDRKWWECRNFLCDFRKRFHAAYMEMENESPFLRDVTPPK